MSFEYPIFQILLYIALFFAPPDTNRIFIGAGDGELLTLQRSGEAWEIQRIPHGDSPAIPEGRVFVEGDAVLLKKGDAWDPPFPMAEYVKLDRNHDWSRQPELRLPFGSVLAKTSDAVVLRVKDGTPEMKSYRIAYMPIEDGKRPTITVNVLGAVARPGAYTLGGDANVDGLLLLAGGLVGGAEWDTIRILRGSADAPLKVVKGLRSPLLDRDTIYVPARVLQDNPPPPETMRFGGVEWLPWRSLFEVRGDELVSLPKVRPGFDYGHWGHGRGPEVVTNIGNPDWRDYRIDADLLVPGVDPAFNPHGLGLDFHGAMIAFHVVDKKESFNESGTSAYILGFEGPGNWSLTAQYNNYCRQPRGWGNNQSDGERRLAGGSDVALDPVRGNRFRIEVRGDRIRIWIDGRQIVDLVDAQMGEPIGGRTLDHGGVAFVGGFDAMIRLRSFEITHL